MSFVRALADVRTLADRDRHPALSASLILALANTLAQVGTGLPHFHTSTTRAYPAPRTLRTGAVPNITGVLHPRASHTTRTGAIT